MSQSKLQLLGGPMDGREVPADRQHWIIPRPADLRLSLSEETLDHPPLFETGVYRRERINTFGKEAFVWQGWKNA